MRKIICFALCFSLIISHFIILRTDAATYTEQISITTISDNVGYPSLVDGHKATCYNVGDVIDFVITDDFTFLDGSIASDFEDVATAVLINEKTLRITCVGRGLTGIKVNHSGGGSKKIYVLVGIQYPKSIGIPVTDNSSGYLYEIPSSANRPHYFGKLTDGVYLDGPNRALETVAGLSDQYWIQRFDDLYQINDIHVIFSSIAPQAFSIDICSEPFPEGYVQNLKLNGEGRNNVVANSGNFTDYYTFTGTTNFGNSNGVIREEFNDKINDWPWVRIYEGVGSELINRNGYNLARIDGGKILNYMSSNSPSASRNAYFVRINFSNENMSPTSYFTVMEALVNATLASVADIPVFQRKSADEIRGGEDKTVSYSVFTNESNPTAQLRYRVWDDAANSYGETKTISAEVSNLNTYPGDIGSGHSNEFLVEATIDGLELVGAKVEYSIKFGNYESSLEQFEGIKLINSISIQENKVELHRNAEGGATLSVKTENGAYTTTPVVKWRESDAAGNLLTSDNMLELTENANGTVTISAISDTALDLNMYKASGFGARSYVRAFAGGKWSAPVPVWILPDVFDNTVALIASPTDITLLNNEAITVALSMPVTLNLDVDGTMVEGVYSDNISGDTNNQLFVIKSVDYQLENDNGILEITKDARNPFAAVIGLKQGVPTSTTLTGATLKATIKDLLGNERVSTCYVKVINQMSDSDLKGISITKNSQDPPALYNGDGSYETLKVTVEGAFKSVKFEPLEENKADFQVFDVIGPDVTGVVTAKIRAIGQKPKAQGKVKVSSVLPGVESTAEFLVEHKTQPKLALYEYGEVAQVTSSWFSQGGKKIIHGKIYPSWASSPDVSYNMSEYESQLGSAWFNTTLETEGSIMAEQLYSPIKSEHFYSVEGVSVGAGQLKVSTTATKNSVESLGIMVTQGTSVVEQMRFYNSSVILKKNSTRDAFDLLEVIPTDAERSDIVLESSDNSVVTVLDNGLIRALKSGAATITANINGTDISASTDIIVPSTGENVALNATITDTAAINTSSINSKSINELNNNNPSDTVEENIYLTGINGELQMDFAEEMPFEVDEIMFVWYTRARIIMPGAYRIQTSADKVNWETLYETSDTTSEITPPIITDSNSHRTITQAVTNFQPVAPFRHMRFTFLEYSGQSTVPLAIRIREIQVKRGPFTGEFTLEVNGGDSMGIGEQKSLTARYNGQNFSGIYYDSDDTHVLTVDSSGNIKAHNAGIANVSALMSDGVTIEQMEIEVRNDITGLAIQNNNKTLSTTAPTLKLSAEEFFNKGRLHVEAIPASGIIDNVTWSVESGSNISIDQNGIVTANSPGNARVKAEAEFTSGGSSQTVSTICNVEVVSKRIPVQEISLDASELDVQLGTAKQANVTLSGASGAVPTETGVIWYSADNTVATVDQSGNITTIGAGNTKIYAVSVDGLKVATIDLAVYGARIDASFQENFDYLCLDPTNTKISTTKNKFVVNVLPRDNADEIITGMRLKGALVRGVDYDIELPGGLLVSTEVDDAGQKITFNVSGTLVDTRLDDINVPIVIKRAAMPGSQSDAAIMGVIRVTKLYSFTSEKTTDNQVRMTNPRAVSSHDNSYTVKITALTDSNAPFSDFKVKDGAFGASEYSVIQQVAGISVASVVGNSVSNTVEITLVGSSIANVTQETEFGLRFKPSIITANREDVKFEFKDSADFGIIVPAETSGNNGSGGSSGSSGSGGSGGGIMNGGGASSNTSGANTAMGRIKESGSLTYEIIGGNEIVVSPKKQLLERSIENNRGGVISINVNLEPNIESTVLNLDADTYNKAKAAMVKIEVVGKGIRATFDPQVIALATGSNLKIKVKEDDAYNIQVFDGNGSELVSFPIAVRLDYNVTEVSDYEMLTVEFFDPSLNSWITTITKVSSSGYATSEIPSTGRIRLGMGKVEFWDTEEHWAKKEVAVLTARSVTNGINLSEFNPDGNITRAEFVTLLVRALKGERDNVEGAGFSDVNEGDWFYNAVNIATQMGIVQGYDGVFNPDQMITREEITVLTIRALKHMDPVAESGQDEIKFEDTDDISDWAREAVANAVSLGFVRGLGDNRFGPKEPTTRAQGATIVYRLLKQLSYF